MIFKDSKQEPTMVQTKQVKCTHCNGTGLYQRHTSYTIDGKPVCFKCGGSGVITVKVTKRRLDRQAKWQITGPFSKWPKDDNIDLVIPF
jgi:hypothetical protein